MSDTNPDIVKLNSLLSNIKEIKSKNDAITKATGGNYNVFRILGLGSDELIFSKMLTNLLRINASHQMEDTFLRLFINKLSTTINIPYTFDYSTAKIHREYYIGPINNQEESSTGGRIDILIEIQSDKGQVGFIIENKVYAEDQKCQLVRYNNFGSDNYKDRYYVLYLTLNGHSPSNESTLTKIPKDDKDENTSDNQFWHEISYKYFIKEWLEDCIKESIKYPYLRETLNQFLDQIKRLTGQDYNKMAEKEVINEICNNLSVAESINENYKYAKYICALSNINTFLEECQKQGFKTSPSKYDFNIENKHQIFGLLDKKEFAFRIYKEEWKNQFFIRFAFEDKELRTLKYGIGLDYKDDLKNSKNSLSQDKEEVERLRGFIEKNGVSYSDSWIYRKYAEKEWNANIIQSKNNPDLVKHLHDLKNEVLKQIEIIETEGSKYL